MQSNINSSMKHYCAYLRKSRKDMEAEAHGEGETLKRHEEKLRSYADSVGIVIDRFYREVKSGETISSRPVIQELLLDVENGLWHGVLVVEVERLARGNTLDQGIVSNAFQYSNTKIITPSKTYDPNNECDEEYFEFGLFMSRREYKKINQRLHEGILASVKEGKHVASAAPYGYDKYKLPKQKGYSLKVNEKEADMIKLIFDLYITGNGLEFICHKINDLGFKPRRSKEFSKSSIAHILTNPVYIGKIKYSDKATVKKVVNGEVVKIRNKDKNIIIVDGIHEPIIDLNTWNKAQNIRKNNLINRTKVDYALKNPMSSILKCGVCGMAMSRITHSNRNDVRICCRKCKENIGSNIDFVESKLLECLNDLLCDYKVKMKNQTNTDSDLLLEVNSTCIEDYKTNLNKLEKQLNKTYELLEQEIYTNEVFKERSNIIKNEIKEINNSIIKLEKDRTSIINKQNNLKTFVPNIEKVIDSYYKTDNIVEKNELLKIVLEKVEYLKISPKGKEDFKLKLYLKIQA